MYILSPAHLLQDQQLLLSPLSNQVYVTMSHLRLVYTNDSPYSAI